MPLVTRYPEKGAAPGTLLSVTHVSSAEILALADTPVTLVAGVPNTAAVVNAISFVYIAGATPYTDNGGSLFVWTADGTAAQWNNGLTTAGFWDQATSQASSVGFGDGTNPAVAALTALSGQPLVLVSFGGANPTLGNGTLVVTLSYFLAPTS